MVKTPSARIDNLIFAYGEVPRALICLGVEPVLEHPHVGGEVCVLGDGRGDLLLVRGGVVFEGRCVQA